MEDLSTWDLGNFETFRFNLNRLVSERGMDYRELAEKIGTTNVSLSRYMNGARKPELIYIVRIALFFNVSVDWLLGLDRTPRDVARKNKNLIEKLQMASDTDREIIMTILSKYKPSK